MHIEVSPQIEKFIQAQVNAGFFSNPEQIVAIALERMMSERDAAMPKWPMEQLRAAIALGADQADGGDMTGQSASDIFVEWKRDYTKNH
jgi:putative addiction module CopG family antidote